MEAEKAANLAANNTLDRLGRVIIPLEKPGGSGFQLKTAMGLGGGSAEDTALYRTILVRDSTILLQLLVKNMMVSQMTGRRTAVRVGLDLQRCFIQQDPVLLGRFYAKVSLACVMHVTIA